MTSSLVPPPDVDAHAQELLRYATEPRELIAGNAVKLLRNGLEAFPAWLAAIEAAKLRVSLEMYIFSDDNIGRKFAAALIAAAARGVEVRLMYDFVGCRDTPAAFFQRMRDGGVHTIPYHRYRFWRPRFWSLIRRNHRKTLVCDGTVAFTGGLNISDEWVSLADGGGDWRDAVIAVRGPAVLVLEAVFVRTWNRRAKKRFRLDPETLPKPAPAGSTRLAVISNSELRERFSIRRAALFAIRESVRRVYLANPYFVPDRGILRAFRQAASRGVDVRLLVPRHSDSRLLDTAARATFGPLLKAGVRIWQSRSVVHTKVLAVDDGFVSIGSYNFDHRSLAYNLEVVVNVLDFAHNADAVAMLEHDMSTCDELTLATFERRTPLARLLERLAYSLRQWL
ncbi:MAG TPA: phospholipase D-like domain-containing protein [Polyangia bacterium]|jgi:cardiolipin synthase|nr:phospholipase D-like domain-containing protein [Polyangia bacterium]